MEARLLLRVLAAHVACEVGSLRRSLGAARRLAGIGVLASVHTHLPLEVTNRLKREMLLSGFINMAVTALSFQRGV
jgi:hypothetical protein